MPVISGSQIISGAVDRALSGVKNELSSINHKLDKLSPSHENVVSNKGTTLHSKGKMVWWTKSKDASCYRLKLFIEDDERRYSDYKKKEVLEYKGDEYCVVAQERKLLNHYYIPVIKMDVLEE